MREKLSRFFPPSKYEFRETIERFNTQWEEQTQSLSEILTSILNQKESLIELYTKILDERDGNLLNSLQDNFVETQESEERLLCLLQDNFIKVKENLEQLDALFKSLDEKNNSILGGVSALVQHESPLDVRFEREYYKDFPVEPSSETPGFKELFLNLIRGLDSESIETVALCIKRLKMLKESESPILALYSAKEKEIMRHRTEHFFTNILQLDDDCFFYQGYFLPIVHFEFCVFVDKCGTPYLDHPERLMNADIIDAGAFVGDSALILSPMTNRKVYSFEPIPSNYALMEKTLKMNGVSNVVPSHYALGNKKEKVLMAVHASASTQFKNTAFEYENNVEAEIITLDSFVEENNLQVGLIKADVEGAEQLLLEGARNTICTQKPALLISIYHNYNDFFKIKPILEDLNLGYRFKIRHLIGGTIMTETILIAEIP